MPAPQRRQIYAVAMEGIGRGEDFRTALRADDVSAAALAAYGRARRAAFADKERVTRALQALIGRRRLANLAARWLAARPRLLDTLLGVIGDYVPPRALPRLLLS